MTIQTATPSRMSLFNLYITFDYLDTLALSSLRRTCKELHAIFPRPIFQMTEYLGMAARKITLLTPVEKRAAFLVTIAELADKAQLAKAPEYLDTALTAATQIIQRHVKNPLLHKILPLLVNQNKLGAAIIIADELQRNDPLNSCPFLPIAKKLLDKGEFTSAINISIHLTHRYSRDTFHQYFAQLQAKQGNLSEAKKRAALIQDDAKRIRTLLEIGKTDKETFDDAKAELKCLFENSAIPFFKKHDLARIFIEIAEADPSTENLNAAIIPASSIKDGGEAPNPFLRIIRLQLKQGYRDGAIASANKIESPYERAIALAEIVKFHLQQDDLNSAIFVVNEIEEFKVAALAEIVKFHLQQDDLNSAILVVKEMEDSFVKDKTLIGIVNFHLKKSNLEAAGATASTITNFYYRVEASIQITQAYPTADHLNTLMAAADHSKCDSQKNKILLTIADLQLAQNDLPAAMETYAKLSLLDQQIDFFLKLIKFHLQKDDLHAVRTTLANIESPPLKTLVTLRSFELNTKKINPQYLLDTIPQALSSTYSKLFSDTAKLEASKGNMATALALVHRIKDPHLEATTLLDMASNFEKRLS